MLVIWQVYLTGISQYTQVQQYELETFPLCAAVVTVCQCSFIINLICLFSYSSEVHSVRELNVALTVALYCK